VIQAKVAKGLRAKADLRAKAGPREVNESFIALCDYAAHCVAF
jgi:hypothetical protein